MVAAAKHPHEDERLDELRKLAILDSGAEIAFDNIVELAQHISDCRIALISLVDEDRQWFKAKRGLDASETPRDVSFCAHAILGDEPFVVNDAAADSRFANNPLVTGEPGIRLYAGVPIRVAGRRLPLGTLCVIDDQPRDLTEGQIQCLQVLASQVDLLMGYRKTMRRLSTMNAHWDAQKEKSTRFVASLYSDLAPVSEKLNSAVSLLLEEEVDLPDNLRPQLSHIFECNTALKLIADFLSARVRLSEHSMSLADSEW